MKSFKIVYAEKSWVTFLRKNGKEKVNIKKVKEDMSLLLKYNTYSFDTGKLEGIFLPIEYLFGNSHNY